MPVYLITVHAYRSWNADNPRGYVRRRRGILPPDANMARNYDEAAKHERIRFTIDLHALVLDGMRDICQRRNWRLHHATITSSHWHALVSWRDESLSWEYVRDTFKRLLGWMLATHTGRKGQKWFVRKGSRKLVRDRRHFEHLMSEYLPDHTKGRRGGSAWREDCGHYGVAYAPPRGFPPAAHA